MSGWDRTCETGPKRVLQLHNQSQDYVCTPCRSLVACFPVSRRWPAIPEIFHGKRAWLIPPPGVVTAQLHPVGRAIFSRLS
jgi:hypothetical protein